MRHLFLFASGGFMAFYGYVLLVLSQELPAQYFKLALGTLLPLAILSVLTMLGLFYIIARMEATQDNMGILPQKGDVDAIEPVPEKI